MSHVTGAATPSDESIAALRAHPRFREAAAIAASANVEFYQGNWLANRVLNDRARFVITQFCMYLHHTRRPDDPKSGLTAARMREMVLAMRAIWDCWLTGAKLDFRGEFYRHTLMTPLFKPEPSAWGPPRIVLAGVGLNYLLLQAEFVAGTGGTETGLASRILEAGYRLEIPRLFAALLLLSLTGILIFAALSWLSRALLAHWHESALPEEE